MLRNAKELFGYCIGAADGDIGEVRDLFFDDEYWVIRYFAVDTRRWLPGRKVLIPPPVLGEPDWQNRVIPSVLTQHEIRTSPDIDTAKPIARRQEEELYKHYQWVPYWTGAASTIIPDNAPTVRTKRAKGSGDPHLRSAEEVLGYSIHASDGDIGKVEDFILDDNAWCLRYLVVNTHKWIPGRRVLLALTWVKDIRWSDRAVFVDHSKEQIRNSPEYNPADPVNRRYEECLYDYYGRPKYWV